MIEKAIRTGVYDAMYDRHVMTLRQFIKAVVEFSMEEPAVIEAFPHSNQRQRVIRQLLMNKAVEDLTRGEFTIEQWSTVAGHHSKPVYLVRDLTKRLPMSLSEAKELTSRGLDKKHISYQPTYVENTPLFKLV